MTSRIDNQEAWWIELQRIARMHMHSHAVQDFVRWTEDWKTRSPKSIFYEAFPLLEIKERRQ